MQMNSQVNIPIHDRSLYMTYYNQGVDFHRQGHLHGAITCYQMAIKMNPKFSEAFFNMANALGDLGLMQEALFCYQQAVHINPEDSVAYYNMGNIYQHNGMLRQAITCYQNTIRLKPSLAEAHFNLANALKDQKQYIDAVLAYQRSLQYKPDYAEAYHNLGIVLSGIGKYNEAVSCFKKAIQLNPKDPDSYFNLANTFKRQDKISEAQFCYQHSILLKSDFAEAYNNLGNVFKDQGDYGNALSSYRQALKCKPDFAMAHSNLLLCLHYIDGINPKEFLDQHLIWANQFTCNPSTPVFYLNKLSPRKRLRIGYVSPDFRLHSVSYFIENILAYHNHDEYEIFGYSNVSIPDNITSKMQLYCDQWNDISVLTDEEAFTQIQYDQIDILIDLAGHTANNRMRLFSMKPAPIQVTYLGYPDTTGLLTMDYRLTDAYTDPEGLTDNYYSETLIRLPKTFLCYKPIEGTLLPSELPYKNLGHITFGSFNDRAKINSKVIETWAEILKSVQNSRLVLKSRLLSDPLSTKQLLRIFEQNGILSTRIIFSGYIDPILKHLEFYNHIDIGLDTFPYNGTTTTCEAIWMGVPVVSLVGQTHVSRVGLSILSNVGLGDMAVYSIKDYIDKAISLSKDIHKIDELRVNLRKMMTSSPLMNAQEFTQSLEEEFHKMWGKYCDNNQVTTNKKSKKKSKCKRNRC
ncbi:MAG: tetratricopeptide repeat protein [Desulfobacterales bacterium]|nr:tetratricopeptide repeat protein [Desulfobacterales bacterium]